VRIGGGVAAVLLTLAVGTGVMLSAIPSHVRAAPLRPHRVLTCGNDHWLDEADRDLAGARYHAALHHLSLSQRDCPHTARRDQLYALAYDGIGDRLGAIAAASRWVDSSNGALDACTLFVTLAHPEGELFLRSDPRCPVQQ
jgi:hypothetical protein